jgi:hypothetical protein
MDTNRSLQFQKRCQYFIRVHNIAFAVVAVCVSNKDRSPVCVHSCNTAPGLTGFAEFVGNQLPVFHTAILSFDLACGNDK